MSGSPTPARIRELRLAASPAAWEAAGFSVQEGAMTIGATPVRFLPPTGDQRGLVGWSLSGIEADAEIDGLATTVAGPPAGAGRAEHPISATAIDHVVVFTPELERTIAAFESAGIDCRRVREVGQADQRLRQGFFRLGEVVVEAVEVPVKQAGPGGAARFWGLTVTVADLDGAVAGLGDRVGEIREAVQEGRRIATVRRDANLGIPVALITPEP